MQCQPKIWPAPFRLCKRQALVIIADAACRHALRSLDQSKIMINLETGWFEKNRRPAFWSTALHKLQPMMTMQAASAALNKDQIP
jgi:hypothetical protein